MHLLSCRSKVKGGEPSPRLFLSSTTPTPTPTPPSRDGSPRFPERKESRRDWSESTQSFVRETDEAFKAVGNALDEAMVAVSPTRPSLEAAYEQKSTETIKPTGPKKPEIRITMESARPSVKRRPSKVSNPDEHLKSPTRTSSVKKSKRKNPRRRRVQIVSKRGSRWALPDNVTEFLNEHWVYPRIEADEMLPPSRLEEIRRSKISRLEVADLLDVPKQSETDDSETPIDAFHLQDLPSRIGAAGVRLSKISESMPTPPKRPDPPAPILWVSPDGAVTRRDFSAPLLIRREQPLPMPAKGNDLKFKDLSFPAPPAKNPARALRQKQVQMPTIEEIIAGPSKALPVPKPKANPTPKPEDKGKAKAVKPKVAKPKERPDPAHSDYVYFKSAPYSLTMPTFKHGPIRFTKATLGLEPQLPPDELLDWTSFQMAILGDAGDVFAESDEFTTRRRSEGEDTDDLASWLAGHGVSGCGSLITRRPGRDASKPPDLVSSSSSKSNSAAPSPASEKSDAPIPVDAEHPNGYWNEASVDATRLVRHHLGMRSCSVKRWTVEGHPKRPAGSKSFGDAFGFPQDKKRRESLESLPQSPMLDLVQSRDYTGKEYTVPMGYNLGHDLGDYLAWESNQMFTGQDQAELP
jgi:hypothetical protein